MVPATAASTSPLSSRRVGGIQASDGSWIDAAQKIDGGPSVLYDAVALLTSEDSVQTLAKEPTARDFVSDAFAHFKFIGYSKAAIPLMEKAGIANALDEACITFVETADAVKFVRACRNIRFWDRAGEVNSD
jgi:catalase